MPTDFELQQERLAAQLGGHVLAHDVVPTIETMRTASGIDDESLLEDLIKLGIRPDGLMLLSVVPLVAVAWVDGSMQPAERTAILRVAESRGIVHGTAPYELLEYWLEFRPGDALLEAWEGFVKITIAKWDHAKAEKFRAQVGGLSRMVAEAHGGFMGIGATSSAEAALIARIESAFDLSWR